MGERTLHFDSPRTVEALLAHESGNLRLVADAFDVQTTSREGWVRLEGSDEAVARAAVFFDEMDRARQRGVPLRQHEFRLALAAVGDGYERDLRRLFETRIDVSPRKRPVAAKTFGQMRYLDAIREHDLVFGIGPAGTGKTYLAMATAVAALRREEVSRIILTRPAVEAGESLGFLPGDMHEKVLPYLRPLYDALYDMMDIDEIQRDMDRGVIEVVPLAYMRGRTLNSAFVILDEAQNATREQMLMFLTRLGFHSRCVVTGDVTQIDLPNAKGSGLIEAARILAEVRGIAIARFNDADVVRHELVRRIILAYQTARGAPGDGDDATPPGDARGRRKGSSS